MYTQALSRPYQRADNRLMLSAVNDSLLSEFVKLLPVLHELQSIDGRVLSRLLSSFSHELSRVLSRHADRTAGGLTADKLCSKLLHWLPCVADVCRRLLTSRSVS